MSTCNTCGSNIPQGYWYCETCGMEREDCAECGGIVENGACNRCNTPRRAPCENCQTLVPVGTQKCPECQYSRKEEIERKAEGSKSFGKKATAFISGGAIVTGLLMFDIGPGIIGQIFGWLMIISGAVGGAMLLGVSGLISRGQKKRAAGASVTDITAGRDLYISEEYLNQWREKKEQAHQRTRIQCPNCGWSTEAIVYGNITKIRGEQRGESDSAVVNAVGFAADMGGEISAHKAMDCKRDWCDNRIYIHTDFNPPKHIKNKI